MTIECQNAVREVSFWVTNYHNNQKENKSQWLNSAAKTHPAQRCFAFVLTIFHDLVITEENGQKSETKNQKGCCRTVPLKNHLVRIAKDAPSPQRLLLTFAFAKMNSPDERSGQ
jgi:hypothetical protein